MGHIRTLLSGGSKWRAVMVALLGSLSLSLSLSLLVGPAHAQELKRKGEFDPAAGDYIIELTNFSRFVVGEDVGDGDGVGEMFKFFVDLETQADRRFLQASEHLPVRDQRHRLMQSTGIWEIRRGDRVTRFQNDETLSVHAPRASRVVIRVKAQERDCALQRRCRRKDTGDWELHFEVPSFQIPLPIGCTTANTFKLQTIDRRWYMGPFPMLDGFSSGGPHLQFDPEYPPTICIRSAFGSPQPSAILYNPERGFCARHQQDLVTDAPQIRLTRCDRFFENPGDMVFRLSGAARRSYFMIEAVPGPMGASEPVCLHHDRPRAIFDGGTVTRMSADYRRPCRSGRTPFLWEYGAKFRGSVSNLLSGACLGTGAERAPYLSFDTCAKSALQHWEFVIPYRLYQYLPNDDDVGFRAFAPPRPRDNG